MNIRTNLRTARKDTLYIIGVEQRGRENPYISAELIGTATDGNIAHAIIEAKQSSMAFKNDNARLYCIRHDKTKNITSSSLAVADALKEYADEFGIDL